MVRTDIFWIIVRPVGYIDPHTPKKRVKNSGAIETDYILDYLLLLLYNSSIVPANKVPDFIIQCLKSWCELPLAVLTLQSELICTYLLIEFFIFFIAK